MDVFMYKAAFHCKDCGSKIKVLLGYSCENLSEFEYDSDQYPKGPFGDGGGEADCPNHCDTCGLFLENPLTGDGEQYVIDTLAGASVTEWREFYDYLFQEGW